MSDSRSTKLCRLCRNLNLRIETFLDLGCRYPTSLEYASFEENVDLPRHYLPGERLDDATDYADEELNQKLKDCPAENVSDEHGEPRRRYPEKQKLLGTLEEVTARASVCTLCALVAHIARTAASSFDKDARCDLRFVYVDRGTLKFMPELYKSDGDAKYGRYRCVLVIENYDIEFHPIHTREDLSWFGSRPYEDRVEFDLCKRWLRACETSHTRCYHQTWQRYLKSPPRLRLIDVHEMCLVDAVGHERYVALSYVWGSVSMFQTKSASLEGLCSSGGLRNVWEDLSRTVQDAIYAVRSLNERYLWTDAVCIIQDDPTDKTELIKEMHVVYARAVLTLIAAEGADANAGLPGIRSNSRPRSHLWDIGNDMALLPSRSVGQVLLDCPWTKRAWTFQEGMLSTRNLVFTNSIVSFTCCSTTWSEHVKSPNEDEEPPWTFAPGIPFDFRSLLPDIQEQLYDQIIANTQAINKTETNLLFHLWTQLIENMSSRSLSFESDILSATAGIISVIQTMFNINTIYGLPERQLEQFLFWSPREPGSLRRRRDINGNALHPTWSWVGWVGEISWTEHNATPSDDEVQEIEWFGLGDLASKPVSLQRKGRGDVGYCVILAADSKDDVRHGETLDFPILTFDTRTAALCISTSIDPPLWIYQLQFTAWALTKNAGKTGSGVYCVTSCRDMSHVVGSVLLDSPEGMLEFENGVAVFAIVSSSTYQDHMHAEDNVKTFHRVLALRRLGGMFERIGHGAIMVDEVSGVVWQKEVILLK